MNNDRWLDLKEKLKDRFGDVQEEINQETREDDVGHKMTTTTERLELDSPLGRLRIERISHPKIIDKKTHYHHAGTARVELILSEDEMSYKINVYKKDEVGEWQPLDLPAERLSF